MLLSLCLTFLVIPHALGHTPTISGKYIFQANDHADFAGNSYALFVCDDTGGDSGKVYFSVWATHDLDLDGDEEIYLVQAMGGTEYDGDFAGGDKVKGKLIMLWSPDILNPFFKFWYGNLNDFRFDMDGLANKVQLTKS